MTKGNWGKIRAFFDLQTQEGFTIKGFKLVEGINGLFVGFPSQKGSDDEYRDTIWAERNLKDELAQLAIKEYDANASLYFIGGQVAAKLDRLDDANRHYIKAIELDNKKENVSNRTNI